MKLSERMSAPHVIAHIGAGLPITSDEWNGYADEVGALEAKLDAVERALTEIKELLGPDSGYHVAPDDAPEGLGELMRVGAIFERANKALAGESND